MLATKPKLIVILGPTASGKTGLALKLAKIFNGEIISADSRQIYKEMDIGTAKPLQNKKSNIKNKNDRLKIKIIENVPHHLIGIIKPNQRFNVALYKKLALKAIKNIHQRGKLPFLVGGTGLYIQAIVDNFDYPKIKPDWKLRKKLGVKTAKHLFSLYKKLDPEGAKKIDKNNKRRLIRAIEVCRLAKSPFWQQRQKKEPLFDVLQIGIKLSENQLKKNIARRTKKMFKAGLEKETKKLFKKYGKKLPALQTIGYEEFKDYKGEKRIIKDYKGVAERIKKHTFQYAKRQMTWFKNDSRIRWVKDYNEAKVVIKRFTEDSM